MTTVGTLGAPVDGPSADQVEIAKLERQNAYLKVRCAQLQDDVTSLGGQLMRVQQDFERLHGRSAIHLEASRP